MHCGGPGASAGIWNLGNRGNGPAGDNKHGLEFQHSQPGHGGMGKFGKVFLFVFNPRMGRGRGGKHWRIATVLRINAPCRYRSGITGSQTLEVSIFTLFSSLFIARRIPPSIPPGLKPLLRGVGAQSDPCPCPAAGKSQIPRTPHSAVAAAAKSLQSCPTLCDPIDGSPPGPLFLGFSRQEHVVSIQPHNNPQ